MVLDNLIFLQDFIGETLGFILEETMTKRLVRVFDVFVILTILISQLSLISGTVRNASAAPAPDSMPTNLSFAGVTISNVSINSGGNSGFVSPGSTFRLRMDYSIVDTACSGWIH